MLTDATLLALRRKIIHGDQVEQLQAIHVLATEANDPRATDVLLEAATVDNPIVQATALGAIPKAFLPRAIPTLQDMLQHPNADLRRVAVRMLGKLRSEESLYMLAQRLSDSNHWVRWEAIDAIAWQNEPWVAEAVVHMLYDLDERVRRRACEVFAMGLSPLPIADLIVALTDPDQWVRFWAIEALRGAGTDHRAVQGVTNLLFDHEALVRDRAIRSLGYMLAADAVPRFKKLAEAEADNDALLATLLQTLRRFETDEAQMLRQFCKQRIRIIKQSTNKN